VFREALSRNGIEVRGAVRVRELHPGEVADLTQGNLAEKAPPATVLASRDSLPLADSLKVMLKVSQNLHAEMLLRTLGHEQRQIGSVEAGLAVIGEFLKEMGVPEDDVLLRDGSGLSRQSLVTPAALTILLRVMYDSPHRDLWMDLLPIAGTDGSLQHRLSGNILEDLARAHHVGAEHFRGLPARLHVLIAVAGDLVSTGSDATHDSGEALGNPPEDEEGCAYVPGCERLQNPLHVRWDPALAQFPFGACDMRRQREDLEVVLDIHGHRVHRARAGQTVVQRQIVHGT